jgi:hypothetical protein
MAPTYFIDLALFFFIGSFFVARLSIKASVALLASSVVLLLADIVFYSLSYQKSIAILLPILVLLSRLLTKEPVRK